MRGKLVRDLERGLSVQAVGPLTRQEEHTADTVKWPLRTPLSPFTTIFQFQFSQSLSLPQFPFILFLFPPPLISFS